MPLLVLEGLDGAGKSTLFLNLNGVLTPAGGEVRVDGVPVTYDRKGLISVRKQVGIVFQDPDDQLFSADVYRDISFGGVNLGLPEEEVRRRVEAAMERTGVSRRRAKPTHALSFGQKKRVAIAGVLAMEPAILILDEATAMLDPRGRKGLMRVCRELHDRGMTVVMITHFMEEAAQADRVIVLEDGHVACDGAPQDVLVQAELLERLNLDLPFAAELSLELQRRGVPVGMHIETTTLKEELCRLLSKA